MAPETPARVLVIDDDPYVCDILSRWLQAEGYQCDSAGDAESGESRLENDDYELLLLDLNLPDKSGLDVLASVKQKGTNLAVVMITAVDDRETAHRCVALGAHSYLIKPFDEDEVLISVDSALMDRDREIGSSAEVERLEQEVSRRTAEIRRREEEIALRLIAAGEFRDEESSGHIRRIGMFAEVLARALGWPSEQAELIRVAAAMHDIGKIGIPDGILLKPRKLTAQEFEIIKTHAVIGANLLGDSDIPLLKMAGKIAHWHHEWWNGNGYPDGTIGEEIPQSARIVAISDVYDSLTHHRHYRRAFEEERALQIMDESRDKQFDPRIYEVFLESLPAFRRIRERFTD